MICEACLCPRGQGRARFERTSIGPRPMLASPEVKRILRTPARVTCSDSSDADRGRMSGRSCTLTGVPLATPAPGAEPSAGWKAS